MLLLLYVLFLAAGAPPPPHHATAGSDATISPVLARPLPAVPEPHQSPRYQALGADKFAILSDQGQKEGSYLLM